eukprot:gene6476-8908_t
MRSFQTELEPELMNLQFRVENGKRMSLFEWDNDNRNVYRENEYDPDNYQNGTNNLHHSRPSQLFNAPNNEDTPKKTTSNAVTSAKYTMVTFLPICLLEQFQKVANLYFLIMSILMMVGSYSNLYDSPFSPWSTLVVLGLVISISIIRSGFEDSKRHESDYQVNSRKLEVADRFSLHNPFQIMDWKDVMVGDLVKINKDQEIPADIVLLASSEADGICFIETANIDGEANLKFKKCVRSNDDQILCKTADDLNNINISMYYEHPNSSIHYFNGKMEILGQTIGIDASSFLLRGSTLKNTAWILGLVAYTGKDTKLIMNSRKVPFKLSTVERIMNNLIVIILAAQVIISIVSSIIYYIWTVFKIDALPYLCYDTSDSTNSIYTKYCDTTQRYSSAGYFFSFLILYSGFIPISLYVTVDICNLFLAYFIDNDIQLYHQESDTPATARVSNMNSDLGMVEYLFSDKTGTLTDNVLRFCRCSVGGNIYGDSPTLQSYDKVLDKSSLNHLEGLPFTSLHQLSNRPQSVESEFALCIALCHTVILEDDGVTLQSESPDEEALVGVSETLGWRFIRRQSGGKIVIEREGQSLVFELLATVPFDSTRKRMSVVVRRPDGVITAFVKGADNIIFERSSSIFPFSPPLANVASDQLRDDNISPKTLLAQHLDLFGTDGLRTLVLAKRDLSRSEYDEFSRLWTKASQTIVGRELIMREAAAVIETKLTIIGATAIEDKLQRGVPQTIVDLAHAGIKIWVLTGDKMETAINIGYSSGLLSTSMVIIKLQSQGQKNGFEIKARLHSVLNKFRKIANESKDVYSRWQNIQKHYLSSIVVERNMGNIVNNDGMFDFSSTSNDVNYDSNTSRNNDDNSFWSYGGSSANEETPLLDMFQSSGPISGLSLEQLTSDHLALIIDGDSLTEIFGDIIAEKMLLSLCIICKSVIACRVSPEQKRLLVRLVKLGIYPRPVTLSIGDGANDVAMIQEAQIGIGMSGKEGRQAVNSSDFSIAQFRYLKRLLLVHGRWDYRRICKVVSYSFHKNILLTLVIFLFTFYSGYSGQSFFDDYVHNMYNIILALPPLLFGIFDRDISEEILMKYSFLYVTSRKGLDLNTFTILYEITLAATLALLMYYVSYYVYRVPNDVWGDTGYTDGLWVFGTTVYTCVIFAMFVRCALSTYTWTWISHLCFWLSFVCCYVIFLVAYQYMYTVSYNFYGITNEMMSSSTFWCLAVLVPTIGFLVEMTINLVRREFFPAVADVGVEFDHKLNNKDSYFGLPLSSVQQKLGEVMSERDIERYFLELDQMVSQVFALGSKRFPVDWQSLQSLWDSLQFIEPARVQPPAITKSSIPIPIQPNSPTTSMSMTSTFNYDHVAGTSTGRGGAGYASFVSGGLDYLSHSVLLFPIVARDDLHANARSSPTLISNDMKLIDDIGNDEEEKDK